MNVRLNDLGLWPIPKFRGTIYYLLFKIQNIFFLFLKFSCEDSIISNSIKI